MDEQAAVKIIRDTFEGSFNKGQFVHFTKNLFNRIDESTFEYHGRYIKDSYKPYIKKYERIGKYKDSEGNKIDILIVNLKRETLLERARTMQRNFVAQYLKDRDDKDAAVVAFHADDLEDWRFSLVKMEYQLTQTKTGRVTAKEELTPARRYSFLVGENEPNHTAKKQLIPLLQDDVNNPTLADLEGAFNIEKVTKEFFTKYRELYINLKEAVDKIIEKDRIVQDEFAKKNVDTVDFAKKLLGQIVFLYFLQKKGWLGVQKDKKTGKLNDWGTGLKSFMRKLFEMAKQEKKNYFNDYLEPLFYEALAIDRREEAYYSLFNCRIPFLNGGLFEPINNYDWTQTDIIIPNRLFSNDTRTKEGDIGSGILDVFDRYNFTVKEDEPLEKEVAIDPEMLGKVFENLLEVKDRKSKGSYYTPREIVHYMCQESLVNYLDTEVIIGQKPIIREKPIQKRLLGEQEPVQKSLTALGYSTVASKEDIENLIRYGDFAIEYDRAKEEGTKTYKHKLPEAIRQNAKLIDERLRNIRICDPAVGSGAFLVGMMSEIVRARNVLTTYLPDQSKKERSIYNFKRDCIQNCLYGTDIDPSAVEIAKLRLWLSLVVDEEDIIKIRPLPNLDYKIVQGNSLLSVKKDFFNADLFNKLEELKPVYFNETIANKKQEYKEQIDKLISQISNGHKDFDFEVYFSEVFHEKKGFDVVIANPPFVRQEKIKDQKPFLQKAGYEVYNSTSDLYTYFYEKSWQILKPDRFLTFISSNKWMRAKYGEKLRQFFRNKTRVMELIDFGGHKVFEATVDTNIILFQKTKPEEDYKMPFVNIGSEFDGENLEAYIQKRKQTIVQRKLSANGWTLADEKVLALKKKIERIGTPLKNWKIKINYGIKTGFNQAFIIDNETKERLCIEDPKSTEILKPILRGRDIGRYYYEFADKWLINSHNGLKSKNIESINVPQDYPAIFERLKQFEYELKKRDDQGDNWWNLRNCAYLEDFEKEKIVWAETAQEIKMALIPAGIYLSKTCFMITGNNLKYIQALSNSFLLDWYTKHSIYRLGSKGIYLSGYFFEQLPVPKITPQNKNIVGEMESIVNQILVITSHRDYAPKANSELNKKVHEYEKQIDQMVYKLYDLTPKEIELVENSNKK